MSNRCVYVHRSLKCGPFYIGMGLPKRPFDRNNRSKKWHAFIAEHGEYEVILLEVGLTIEQAAALEIESIEFIGLKNLVNRSKGGQYSAYGMKHSDESKRKIGINSASRRPENRVKLRDRMMGSGNPMFGKTRSVETRSKIKISRLDGKASLETRLRMSLKASGKNNSAYNDQLFAFVHERFGYVICTQFDLRRRFKLSQPGVSQIVNGHRKSTNGWAVVTPV